MLTKVESAAVLGLEAYIINVEVDTSAGIGRHTIVGLPDTAVKESKERIESAIKNSDISMKFYKKFTVNLAPADLRKEGPAFDLPIAIAMLSNEGLVPAEALQGSLFLGELSLNGDIRPIKGVLAMAIEARAKGFKRLYLPYINAPEAKVVNGIAVYGVSCLTELVNHLNGTCPMELFSEMTKTTTPRFIGDFTEVKGQISAKRALEIAAAGGHNVLMIGSPGSGKTMLARRFNTILPELSYEESIEVSKVYSIAGLLQQGLISQRQVRSPHHTISNIGIAGGGRIPKPGEISLAHLGVLFMDEFPEFDRRVLEVLRQPMEDGEITISRALVSLTYPAKFILVAAMNPCPCGYLMDKRKRCVCSPLQIDAYRKKISGPIMDRIDLIVEVPSLSTQDLAAKSGGEASNLIRQRVTKARAIQTARYSDEAGVYTNSQLSPSKLQSSGLVSQEARQLLNSSIDKLNLSARAYDRVLKVSRTIADLASDQFVLPQHIAEALQFRASINYAL